MAALLRPTASVPQVDGTLPAGGGKPPSSQEQTAVEDPGMQAGTTRSRRSTREELQQQRSGAIRSRRSTREELQQQPAEVNLAVEDPGMLAGTTRSRRLTREELQQQPAEVNQSSLTEHQPVDQPAVAVKQPLYSQKGKRRRRKWQPPDNGWAPLNIHHADLPLREPLRTAAPWKLHAEYCRQAYFASQSVPSLQEQQQQQLREERWELKKQQAMWRCQRELGWNQSKRSYVPPAVRGIKSTTPEPWAKDSTLFHSDYERIDVDTVPDVRPDVQQRLLSESMNYHTEIMGRRKNRLLPHLMTEALYC